jgi:hypothetical protein
MQITESEIVIPLKYKERLKAPLIILCGFLAYFIALCIFLINLTLKQTSSQFPDIRNDAHNTMLFEVCAFIFIVILYSMLFAFFIRRLRAPSPYVCINHEGIFTSRDSFLIKWREIRELSLATFMGSPYLRIVPWNGEEIATRAKASSRLSMRFAIDATVMLFRRSKSPAPIGLSQMVLPISIQELLVAIQEHFGTELREHHILIQNTQN